MCLPACRQKCRPCDLGCNSALLNAPDGICHHKSKHNTAAMESTTIEGRRQAKTVISQATYCITKKKEKKPECHCSAITLLGNYSAEVCFGGQNILNLLMMALFLMSRVIKFVCNISEIESFELKAAKL